jgi:hypothetical protein
MNEMCLLRLNKRVKLVLERIPILIAVRLEVIGEGIFGIVDIDGVREREEDEIEVGVSMGPVEDEIGPEEKDIGGLRGHGEDAEGSLSGRGGGGGEQGAEGKALDAEELFQRRGF